MAVVDKKPSKPGYPPGRRPRQPWTARRALRLVRNLAIAVLIVAALVIGWNVSQINIGNLITGLPRMQGLLVALVQPDIIEQVKEERSVEIPLGIGCSDSSLNELDNLQLGTRGVTLLIEPRCALPGQQVSLAGERFPPGSTPRIQLIDNKGYRQTVPSFPADDKGRWGVGFVVPDTVTPDSTYQLRVTDTVLLTQWRLSDTFTLAVRLMIETVFLALMATVLAVAVSVPLSFLAARNLMTGPVLIPIYVAVRTVLNLTRSIEVLIVALIFVVAVGIGPFAGMLALVIHSIATLGKLYSEAIESIDPGPIEAITATGANRIQTVIFAVLPQVIPQFVSFTIYRWDINVRMATVIGLVGGGGIGFVLKQYIDLLQWNQAATCMWLIAAVVMVMDFGSSALRKRIV